MKKRFWILALAAILAAAGGIASAAVAASFEEEAREAREPSEPASGGYVLAGSHGNIGLYEDGKLLLEADVPVSGLRQADQELVSQGIRADTWEEALKLLEDFGA